MDTLSAYARSLAAKNSPRRVFDWDKAARIIKERHANSASAGLQDDWEYTGGPILKGGMPVDREVSCCYLASNWAIPELEIGGEVIECFKMEREAPGWDAETFWPESALEILSG